MPSDDLLILTDSGFYCAAGDFYVDPWRPVPRAVITHAHADHYTDGCGAYLVAAEGAPVFRARLGHDAPITFLPYGATTTINGVRVSLHPAGHILGSAQVRVEHGGDVWVVSGDYKTAPDATCAPFAPVRCRVFISEATFGLPIYRWRPQAETFAQINAWWRANQADGRASVLFGYALGKAQRLLAGVDASIGPIYAHGAVQRLNAAYRAGGVTLPATAYATDAPKGSFARALIVAPPSARGTVWLRRFGPQRTGFASGWMQVRGTRRRRAVDRGFVLSDHADWPGLHAAIRASDAERVGVTHGYTASLARWLAEHGLEAVAYNTRYEGERDDEAIPTPDDDTPPTADA